MIHDYYGWGCARDRIERIRHAAGIVITIEDNTLTAWGRDLAGDDTATPPVISAATGMLGYPAYNQDGVSFRTLFRPDITYLSPVRIQAAPAVQGDVPMASDGVWAPYLITHQLESEVPDGAWFTHVAATRTGNPAMGGMM